MRRLRSDVQKVWFAHSHLARPHLASDSERGYNIQYSAIHRLNDDILLNIFDHYRLDNEHHWNARLLWCKLSHVCQRWRRLIYKCAFHLGMHIECTNGSPIMDTLDHLPPLPLFVSYHEKPTTRLTEQDESGIYHVLRLHGRLRHIDLRLPPSILHQVVVLMDEHFPILEHLSLRFAATIEDCLPIPLPKAFLATNLRHLTLPGISPLRRLQMLTSTVSLVRLRLSNIQISSYFRPRLLVARLRSLPQLKELFIIFSTPIPHPGTESELLGEQGAPVTLPSLEYLRFEGVGAYLESLVAQITVPLLKQLEVTLFNETAFTPPLFKLSHMINTTEVLKHSSALVGFFRNEVYIVTVHHSSERGPLQLRVICNSNPLDWRFDCAAQICQALLHALSRIEDLRLYYKDQELTAELWYGTIDSATWHNLLRSFIGLKCLCIDEGLLEELSRALEVDGVGSDPGFLPNLRTISARRNLNMFTSFIDTRRVVGRPVQYSRGWY